MKDRLDTFEAKLVEMTKEFTAIWKDVRVQGHEAAFSQHNQEAADEVAAGVAEELRRGYGGTPTTAQKDEIIRSQKRTLATDCVRLARAWQVNDDQARDIAALKHSLAIAEKAGACVSDERLKAETKRVAAGEIATAQAKKIEDMQRGIELAAESIFGS
jgi:hypothetical protein